MNEAIDYSEEWQKVLIQFMISDQTSFALSQNIISPNYFDNKLRPIVKFVLNYSNDYKTIPTIEQINAVTDIKLEKLSEEVTQHSNWYLETIEKFCRHKALENVVLEGVDMLEKGQYGDVEKRVKEAMMISLQRDLGTDYFKDPAARLKNMRDNSSMVSTGWKVLDEKLYGGTSRGTLNIFCGSPGQGKSLILQNISLNLAFGGYDVVYITLELSEDLVAMRLDSMVSGIPTREIFKKLDEVDLKIRLQGRNCGKITIKKMPEAGTSANTIRAYIKEYEIKNGKKPDAIVIDYLDLLYPNNNKVDVSNLFVKDKLVSEEIRALMGELDCLHYNASQLGRGSIEETEFSQAHIAGGISKINTADNVFAIFTSQAMKERGEYQIQFLKTRTSSAVGQKITLKFDPTSMRISDPDPEDITKQREYSAIAEEIKNKTDHKPTVQEEKPQESKRQDVHDLMSRINKIKNQ